LLFRGPRRRYVAVMTRSPRACSPTARQAPSRRL